MRFGSARSYITLSIAAAVLTMALKFFAYALTGSVGLLSDALESLVNLAAALIAFWALTLAARPADEEHHYGHSKAEYFASGIEGGLIVLAAVSIAFAAVPRLIHPLPLDRVGIGLLIAVAGAVINGGVALVLADAGRRLRSVSLQADSRHLMTDVWTTCGVLVGVALVGLTGWLILDPIIALIVAANIVWTGVKLVRESSLGLMDTALPPEDQRTIADIQARYRAKGIEFHALRTRRSGSRRFVSMHVLVPGDWTVKRGHDLCEEVEMALHNSLPETTVFTHLEPLEDPTAWQDTGLDRQMDNIPSQP
ncbi:MAG TPA: cation diffusion facilitator family transporter [Ktedonobacterales bacterium]